MLTLHLFSVVDFKTNKILKIFFKKKQGLQIEAAFEHEGNFIELNLQ